LKADRPAHPGFPLVPPQKLKLIAIRQPIHNPSMNRHPIICITDPDKSAHFRMEAALRARVLSAPPHERDDTRA
jgi:hypothetical protein